MNKGNDNIKVSARVEKLTEKCDTNTANVVVVVLLFYAHGKHVRSVGTPC